MNIELDEERHIYRINGKPQPSVTQIISGLGLYDTRNFNEEGRVRGRHVHKAIHFWMLGDLDWETVHPPWAGYVNAAIQFLSDAGADPAKLQTEVVVGNQTHGYCGTADVLGPLFGRESVADWKSGSLPEVIGLQTAGYDLAAPLSSGSRRTRLGIELREDGTYRKTDVGRELDPSGYDYRDFPAGVRLYRKYIWPRVEKELLNAA